MALSFCHDCYRVPHATGTVPYKEDAMADIALLRVHAWFDHAITEALKDVAPPPTDPAQFAKATASGTSLSVGSL